VTPGLVSIVVPVWNRPGPLAEAVGSALAQTYRPIEVVIVDDASTDATPEVAARLARERPEVVRLVRREANGGPGRARESGREIARGEYLQYLDSDDLLLPRKLEGQVAALRARPECGIAYGICRETEPDGSERRPALRPSDVALETMFPTFLTGRWWNTVAPLYRAELCARAGPWSDLRLEEDWELDARIAALGPRLAFVPEVVAVHRDLGGARASRGAALDPARLAERARAQLAIAQVIARRPNASADPRAHAERARALFHLARRCGAARSEPWGRLLLAEAEQASRLAERSSWDISLYRVLAGAVGRSRAGRLADTVDRVREFLGRERRSIPK
jgi:hypothetical protein